MVKIFTVSFVCLSVSSALLTTYPVNASTITVSDPAVRHGGPITQNFLDTHGDNVSMLATRNGVSCVASQTLPIAEAQYLAPDSTVVSFADVTRSPASSIQAIARPDTSLAFRIQLKYSPDPTSPISMEIDGQTLDVATFLEASSDSLWLTGDIARILAEALRRGDTPVLRATSDGTTRQVSDQITTPDMDGLEACLVTLEELLRAESLPKVKTSNLDMPDMGRPNGLVSDAQPSTVSEVSGTLAVIEEQPSQPALPVPVAGLRLEFVARPDPETRIEPNALKTCRMRDIPESVFLGRLITVTGFFSHTQDIYVAFDDDGKLQRAYIPGIFDSDLTMGANHARISLAADSNLPDQPNTVRGCLGDSLFEAPVCAISEDHRDGYTVAECGVLGTLETREKFPAPLLEMTLPVFNDGTHSLFSTTGGDGSNTIITAIPRTGSRTSNSGLYSGLRSINSGPFSSGASMNSGPFSNGASFNSDEDDGSNGGRDDKIPPVPLPAALWLMVGALTGLSGFGVLRRRKVHV